MIFKTIKNILKFRTMIWTFKTKIAIIPTVSYLIHIFSTYYNQMKYSILVDYAVSIKKNVYPKILV